MGVSAADVEARLRNELAATEVQVQDIAGCGTSFEVHVVSPQFEGKRLLERHKLVNAALAPLMPEIHALSIKKAKSPAEVAAQ
ncbi:putative bolA [Chlorella sorokiniana]|uniref:BolA n=1 Tax=Chlorella sorokiniana TaxID=3076 RepID=A0A2P6TEM9_CHLSO|nr:putative bolA [Chlorella sorokiniana]|eukprot:PRW21101.1 putative bolA [Chlorella sorokiniana]